MFTPRRRGRAATLVVVLLALVAVASGSSDDDPPAAAQVDPNLVLKISAIPDQDPANLSTINSTMATYLAGALGVKVEYVPVTDYAAYNTVRPLATGNKLGPGVLQLGRHRCK